MTAGRMHDVGPVLVACDVTSAVVQAITSLNPSVNVVDRGSYLRIASPGRCVLTRAAAEAFLGRPLRFPSDLEAIMPSFAGRLTIDESGATWTA